MKTHDGFKYTPRKKVRTMAITKEHIHLGSAKVYDTNLINTSNIGLQGSGGKMKDSQV